MVVHFSSKLSHLAQSFRPQHHFNSIRNAFPSTSGSASTSNVFGSATNSVGGGASQAAGAGAGGTAGGAGGAKWSAGSRAPNWGFQVRLTGVQRREEGLIACCVQSHGRLVAQAPAGADSNSRLNEDEEEGLGLRRPGFLRSHSAGQSKLGLRRNSTSLAPADRPDLLNVEEEGLSSVRLSSAQMQLRYRNAFNQGQKTEEMVQSEMEADELDFGPPTNVVSSGRRASVSRSMVSTPILSSANPAASPSSARALHTSSAFPASSPPLADVPRTRRNSTSSVGSSSSPIDTSVPIVDLASIPRVPRVPRVPRPRNSSPADSIPSDASQARSADYQPQTRRTSDKDLHLKRIRDAVETGNYVAVQDAVRRYLAVASAHSSSAHNTAMEGLFRTRPPYESIDNIVQLYGQLFENERLRPDKTSYSIMIRALCLRDDEILRGLATLENKRLKKILAGKARGAWNGAGADDNFVLDTERQEVERLQKEDSFSSALQIYQALGPNADRLPLAPINALIKAAYKRKRVELALSLFTRLENSPHQRAMGSTYAILIKMFGEEKDRDGVTDVFEGYIAARAAGLPASAETTTDRLSYEWHNAKHRHSTNKIFVPAKIRVTIGNGDEIIWRLAIRALFECADDVGAIALLERMQAAQTDPETRVAGSPPGPVEDETVKAIVMGFLQTDDEVSARKWFDQRATPREDGGRPDPSFFYSIFFEAIQTPFHSFVNHVYRAMLAHPHARHEIGHFVTAVDYNLALVYSTTDVAVRDQTLDDILEFKAAFAALSAAGQTQIPEIQSSTGLLTRITQALGTNGRPAQAAETFVELARAVSQTLELASHGRSTKKWALTVREPAAAALGFLPRANPTPGPVLLTPTTPLPAVSHAATVVGAFDRVQASVGFDNYLLFEDRLVESYLAAKAAANGDVVSLGLSGEQWFTVVKAFANVAVSRKEQAYEFPGFEPIIEDFAASGVRTPAAEDCDYGTLVMALQKTGMERARILGVLSILDRSVADAILNGDTSALAAATPPPPPASVPALELAEKALASVKSIGLEEALATSLPSPPATPPTYFAQLPAPPIANAPRIDAKVSSRLDSHLRISSVSAFDYLASCAGRGELAHPDSIGYVIEQLGRDGESNKVHKAYLIAYSAINAMGADPEAQSISWIMLEDRMIIALAQMGALNEVGVHKLRLLEAGSAPSADGYAAMIINMKETTDDAAIALELFEESQRFKVVPNVYLFNTLISKLSRARRAKDAIDYFGLMKDCGLRPSSITYGAIINACCKTGDVATAEVLFKEMVESPGFKPRVPPYNTMIQFYTQTKPSRERALYFYDQMLKAGVQPTGHTYKLLLDAYGAIGDPDPQSMSDVFDRLLADPTVTVTGAHWASLINAWGCVAKDLDRARSIFDSIATHPSTVRSRSNLPDAVVFESLLNAFLANQRPDLCEKYLGEMKLRGVRMTAYVANTLIKVRSLLSRSRSLLILARRATHLKITWRAPAPSSSPSPTLQAASLPPATTPPSVTPSTARARLFPPRSTPPSTASRRRGTSWSVRSSERERTSERSRC